MLSATSVKKALLIAEKRQPNLIITDWEMPEMSGLELIKSLKRNKNISHIPCVMITGMRTTAENLGEAFKEGAIDFIRKPIN